MRVSKAGVYVMIKQYGIEGLLSQSNGKAIEVDAEKEEASIPGELG